MRTFDWCFQRGHSNLVLGWRTIAFIPQEEEVCSCVSCRSCRQTKACHNIIVVLDPSPPPSSMAAVFGSSVLLSSSPSKACCHCCYYRHWWRLHHYKHIRHQSHASSQSSSRDDVMFRLSHHDWTLRSKRQQNDSKDMSSSNRAVSLDDRITWTLRASDIQSKYSAKRCSFNQNTSSWKRLWPKEYFNQR